MVSAHAPGVRYTCIGITAGGLAAIPAAQLVIAVAIHEDTIDLPPACLVRFVPVGETLATRCTADGIAPLLRTYNMDGEITGRPRCPHKRQ